MAEITVVHLKQKVPWSWEPAGGVWKWETFIVLSSSSFQFLQWKQFHFIRDTFPSHCPTSPPPTLLLMIIFKAEHLVGFRVGERGKKNPNPVPGAVMAYDSKQNPFLPVEMQLLI